MRQATPQEIRKYKTYLRNHIDLVYTLGKKAFNMDFSNHDLDKIHGEGYKMNLMTLRNVWNEKEYRPSDSVLEMFNEIIFQHTKTNKHHPEYWDKSIRFEDYIDSENSKIVDMSEMTTEAFNELCCDWAAVALNRNMPLMDWYNLTCFGNHKKYNMSSAQHKRFKSNMKKIYDCIVKYDIYYPGVKYTATNIFEEKSVNKRSQFLESYISIRESKSAMSFKFKTPYDVTTFTKEMPYVWSYVDVSKPNIATIYWNSDLDRICFLNNLPKKTKSLILDQKILKEEVSSGAFSGFVPETPAKIKCEEDSELTSIV